MADQVETLMLKAGMPTVAEARTKLNQAIDRARQRRTVALKVIHGYGSSGSGGVLRGAVRRSLRKRKKEGKIRAFAAGEDWSIYNETVREILDACPQLERDPDLNRYNEGVTIVLL